MVLWHEANRKNALQCVVHSHIKQVYLDNTETIAWDILEKQSAIAFKDLFKVDFASRLGLKITPL